MFTKSKQAVSLFSRVGSNGIMTTPVACVSRANNQFLAQQMARTFSTTTTRFQEETKKPEQQQQQQQQQQQAEKKPEQQQQETKVDPNVELIAKLKKEIETKNAKIKDMEQKVLYTVAEMENSKRMAQNDIANSKKYAITGFGKNLLDVADNLGRAIQTIATPEVQRVLNEKPDEKSTKLLRSMFQGVDMTQSILLKTFETNTIKKMDAKQGTKFDPAFHEAISLVTAQSATQVPGTIANVIKEGYTIGDRILRAAAVAVFVDENGDMEPAAPEAEKKQ